MSSQYDLPYTGNQVEILLGEVTQLKNAMPEKVSDLPNDSGYITAADLPTKTSDLTNDSGFITNAPVNAEAARAQAAEALLATIASLQAEITRATGVEGTLQGLIDGIEAKIPLAASGSNQLADKSYVNASIATASATFRGTYTSLVALQAVAADENDYGYVISTDAVGNTIYNRYKYANSTWTFEYAIANPIFDSSQWAAINSAVTAELVNKLSALPDNATLTTALAAKQDVIDDLSSIRSKANSAYQKPSGGIPKTDLEQSVQTTLDNAEGALSQDDIADNLTTDDATKPLSAKQGKVLNENLTQLGQEVDEKTNSYPTTIDLDEFDLQSYVILDTGKWGTAAKYKHIDVPVKAGEKYVITAKTEYATRYSFLTSDAAAQSGADAPIVSGTAPRYDLGAGQFVRVEIPATCNYLYIVTGDTDTDESGRHQQPTLVREIGFDETYPQFLQKTEQELTDEEKEMVQENIGIPAVASKAKEWTDAVADNLTWGLVSMANVYKVTKGDGTFVSASAGTYAFYTPITKGELFRIKVTGITGSVPVWLVFSQNIPAVGGSFTNPLRIYAGDDIVMQAPIDGYLVLTKSPSKSDGAVYKVMPDTTGFIKHSVPLSFTKAMALDCLSDSLTYGNLVTINSNNWGVSDYVDVSGYSQLLVKVYYSSASFLDASSNTKLYGALFFDANEAPLSSCAYIAKAAVAVNGYELIAVPAGAKFFRFTAYIATGVVYGLNTEGLSAGEVEEIVESVVPDTLKEIAATTGAKTIFELNPDTEMLQKFVLVDKKKYLSSGTNSINPLTIAHLSDVHGQATQYARFLEFANHWKTNGYVDEIIDTGDVVENDYLDGIAWRDSIDGIEDVITVIGNHDTNSDKNSGDTEEMPAGQNQWQYHSNISLDETKRHDTYDRYLIGPDSENPYIDNWGVTQPSGAAESGVCYYYKDYASRNLRMIALDVMGYNETEDLWLQARLAEAKTAGYHVVIVAHFCGEVMTGLPCNYTSLFAPGSDRSTIDGYNAYAYHIPISVDAFQQGGGVFVGYIIGHYHRDMVNILTNYPKQLAFAVSSGGRPVIRDTTKVVGSKSYDDFQIVSINTYDKTVRLIKVGADTDYYMRKKGTLCVSYEIVTVDNVDRVEGVLGEGW